MKRESDKLIPLDYGSTIPTAPARATSRTLHWVALLTACATFPLIFMGGLVTSHHAGMSVPDWPNSYGYNMFLFPPSHWVGGILFEHVHRLMGTVVGFLAVMLTLNAWGVARCDDVRKHLVRATWQLGIGVIIAGIFLPFLRMHLSPRIGSILTQTIVGLGGLELVLFAACFARTREPHRFVRWTATAVLGVVIFQGVLGGLRVVLVKLDLAIVHACVAQAFFCLTAYAALVMSKWWENAGQDTLHGKVLRSKNGAVADRLRFRSTAVGETAKPQAEFPSVDHHSDSRSLRRVFVLGLITVAAIYLQLIVGATMRHFDAGLAIPDIPLAYGKVLPPTSSDSLDAVNHLRAFQLNLDPVTLGQIWIHFAHRIGAVIVSLLVIALVIVALRRSKGRGLAGPAVMLLLLLIAQVALGVLTVLLRKPADVASSHVAVGALVLMTSFVLTAQAGRLSRRDPRMIVETSPVLSPSARLATA